MLAAVNPCGFALLPACLSLLVLGDDAPTPPRSRLRSSGAPIAAVGRALAATAAMTAGFTATECSPRHSGFPTHGTSAVICCRCDAQGSHPKGER